MPASPVALGGFLSLTAALLVALALWRNRQRGPLAAALFFGGTLFPALGFFNVFPFVYSFVADHFQYLACLGPITLAAAALSRLRPRLALGASIGVPIVLGVLTWQQKPDLS